MKKAKTPIQLVPHSGGRSSEDLALQIEAAILSGALQPGDRLPSEREIQAQFGSGRGVVREALSALKEKGLVEIRKGSAGGAYVKQMEVAQIGASLAIFLKQNRISARQLIEFRESIDRPLTNLAIARGSLDEKRELVELAGQLLAEADKAEPDQDVIVEQDRRLNLFLAQMAKNPIFEWIMRALQSGFSSYDFWLYQDPEYRLETAANWVETAREIAAGDPHAALSRIGYHYVLLRQCLHKHGEVVGGDAVHWARGTRQASE